MKRAASDQQRARRSEELDSVKDFYREKEQEGGAAGREGGPVITGHCPLGDGRVSEAGALTSAGHTIPSSV